MPGPAVHTIISEKLPAAFANDHPGVKRALDANRSAMTYGAMGPDPFFFNLNDVGPSKTSLVKTVLDVWDWVGRINYRLNELFAPIQQAVGDVKDAIGKGVNTLAENSPLARRIRNTLLRFRELGRLLGGVVRGFLKKSILDRTDPFGLYISPYQRCEDDHERWWWFDTLHTRQTGDFASSLLDIATGRTPGKDGRRKQRDEFLAYSVGYLSHLAADVVGHAYVNTMVGGPYRLNQAQRHTTQEKLMDVRVYDYYYENGLLQRLNRRSDRFYQNPNLLNSGLHKNQQFTDGKYDPENYQIDHDKLFQRPRRMNPTASGLELPDAISGNFATAANATYDTGEFGTLTEEEVDLSYRLWYLKLRNSTSTRDVVPPSELPAVEVISEETRDAWEEFKDWFENTFGSSPDIGGGGGSCASGGNVTERIWDCVRTGAESAWNFITNTAERTVELFKAAMGLIRFIAEDLASLPLVGLNFLLQKMYEGLYTSYRNLLVMLTALGFGYCYGDQLRVGPIEHLWNPSATDHFGNTVADTILQTGDPSTSGYPREGVQMGPNWHDAVQGVMQGISQEGHLVIPTTPVEEPETVPGPDVYGSATPEVFVTDPDDHLSFDGDYIPYNTAGPDQPQPGGSPSTPSVDDYRPTTSTTSGFQNPVLGTAVQLTRELFDRYLGSRGVVPNLNMSGDRAIGYPNWYNDPEGRDSCKTLTRYRWAPFNNRSVRWLNDDPRIEPKFYPDTNTTY